LSASWLPILQTKMADSKHEEQAVSAILRHSMFNVLIRDFGLQTEVELFSSMGDAAQTAAFMATATSYAGMGEFLLNPLVARLSDRFGRKPFLNLLCGYSVVGNLILSTDPYAKIGPVPFVVINRTLTGLLGTQGGSVMGTNAMSDVSSGPQLGINLAKMGGAFGAGTIIGPMLGNRAFKAGGHVAVYRVRAAMAVVHLLHNLLTITETLPKSIPFSLAGLNPFGFLKLLVKPDGALLQRLSRALLICTSEQKILINLKTLWLKQDVGLSMEQAQTELMAYAASIWASGQLFAPRLIKALGAVAFTDMTSLLNVLTFATWGSSTNPIALWLGLLLHVPGCNGTGASMVKADMITRAGELGIGKGEMNGYFMNLRALSVMIIPQLLGRSYVAQVSSGKGGQAFYILAFCAALSMVLRK